MLSNELVDYLSSGATLLTPTRRLALRVKELFNQQQAQFCKAWLSPMAYSLEDWCMSLWEDFENKGKIHQQLLTRQQGFYRFEEIVKKDAEEQLLQVSLTSKLAYGAYELLHCWLMQKSPYFSPENEEEAAFLEWVHRYEDWLIDNQLLDNAQLVAHLIPLLQEVPARTLILYAFEELPPIYQRLLTALSKFGWQIVALDPPNLPSNEVCYAFHDQKSEYQAAANFAKSCLKKGNQRVAIVVPELVETRDSIEKIFADTFEPLAICQPNATISPYFNISAAVPLAKYPLMHSLCEFLKLGLAKFPLKDYAAILNSCFTSGYEEEYVARSQHVLLLKNLRKETISLDECIDLITRTNQQVALVTWHKMLITLRSLRRKTPQQMPLGQWKEHFLELLESLGWPGTRSLNSIEHQVVKRAYELVQEICHFEEIIVGPTYAKALSLLQQCANQTPFQPENKQAPVQILGVLEADGQTFDSLWVTGMHNEAWPPPAKPNPFIPLSLQREFNVPHALAQREYTYCSKVTSRLKNAAFEVVFSFPQTQKERALEQSELISPPTKIFQDNEDNRIEYLFTKDPLEKIEDQKTSAVDNLSSMKATATSLALMSACPFKAFASLRLNAKSTPWSSVWLEPRERGIILHRVLEDFWQIFSDQKTLCETPISLLEEKMQTLIQKHLQPFKHQEASQLYYLVEIKALLFVMMNYLEKEKKRPPFRVLKNEEKVTTHLGGLDFHLRFDRIDEIANEKMLVDYKTGQFSLTDMWGERPKAPQFPLYFLAAKEHLSSMMAIKLQSKGAEFVGISEYELDIKGVSPLDHEGLTWQDLKGYWQAQLLGLIEHFKAGNAAISPLEGATTCQYCDYQSLCRIHEAVK